MNRKQQGKFLLEKSYTKTAAQIGKTNLCGCKPNFMELKRKQSRLRQKRSNCPEYAGTCKQHDDACEENTAHDGENAGLKVHIEDTCGQCAGPCAGSRERDADEEQQGELLGALLSGDRKTFELFRTEAPELRHLPAATYEWYSKNYLDRDYPLRFILMCNGVEFPDTPEEDK